MKILDNTSNLLYYVMNGVTDLCPIPEFVIDDNIGGLWLPFKPVHGTQPGILPYL